MLFIAQYVKRIMVLECAARKMVMFLIEKDEYEGHSFSLQVNEK